MGKTFSKDRKDRTTAASRQLRTADDINDIIKDALKQRDATEESITSPLLLSVALKDVKSAHYFVVVSESIDQGPWVEIGITEMSPTTSGFRFERPTKCVFRFEAVTRIKLSVYKSVLMSEIKELRLGEPISIPTSAELAGSIECILSELVSTGEGQMDFPLGKGGHVSLSVDEIRALETSVGFSLRLVELDTTAIAGKYHKTRKLSAVLHRSSTEGSHVRDANSKIVQSESIEKAADSKGWIFNVNWKPFKETMNTFCRGDVHRDIIIEIWESESKVDYLIGYCTTNVLTLQKAAQAGIDVELDLIGTKRASVCLNSIDIRKRETFLDYIAAGLAINLFVAIDFTKSNKDPHLPDSLHSFTDPNTPNDFVKVIQSVANILQSYEKDKRIGVYGFGARLPPAYSHTSHCFACNGDFFNPEVVGVDGIIKAYRNALESVVLHGPTNFNEVIKLVADLTAPYADPNVGCHRYSVLLILTDGVITDMKQTINEIVRAAELPMSVVIVGIGEEDFGLMKILDADDQRLYSTDERKFASRDIVQFVRFKDFKDRPIEVLAAETLAELPREVVNYFKARDIVPRSKTTTESHSVVEVYTSGQIPEKEPESSIGKQLAAMKREFLEAITKVTTDVDEFEAYRIITEEHVPSNDLTHFKEILAKGPRGVNVLSILRPTNIDSPPDSATKSRKVLGSAQSPASRQSPVPAINPSIAVDISNSDGLPETVAQQKPLLSPISALSSEARAMIAQSFTMADLKTSPRATSPGPTNKVPIGEVVATLPVADILMEPAATVEPVAVTEVVPKAATVTGGETEDANERVVITNDYLVSKVDVPAGNAASLGVLPPQTASAEPNA